MSDIHRNEPKRSFTKKLMAITPSGLFKLILACLGVGVVLAALDVNPRRIWVDFFDTINLAWAKGWQLAGGAIDYLLLGAILVIPVFIILRVLKAIQEK